MRTKATKQMSRVPPNADPAPVCPRCKTNKMTFTNGFEKGREHFICEQCGNEIQYESYHAELAALTALYQKANPGRALNPGEFDADGSLNSTGARKLHEELCRLAGMTADQIVTDWNRQSPEDLW